MLTFDSLDEEVQFLRGLVAVQRLADEVLEDCIERSLGLAAAADVYLTQCARMIHARGAFVQVVGADGPVLTRVWGNEYLDVTQWAQLGRAQALVNGKTVFVAQLTLGSLRLGAIGFVLEGHFSDAGAQVSELVKTIAEMFDSALLSFMALTDGQTVLDRLSELGLSSDFEPHARIGKYELISPLGTGGMAQVMVARTVNPAGVSRLVALKRILPKLAEDEAIVHQFLDEAKLGMRLNHPNLVTLFDFGHAGGSYFLAMELIRGVDFDHLISWPYGPLAPNLISAIVSQALEGLHAAHELRGDDGLPLGLVHRDLSPHNIMVGFDGRVKILDFGVAKMRDQRTVTLAGVVKGKPLYMSPEQATAERVDRRSDLFSMGLILYEAAVGSRAFERPDDTQSMEAIVNDALVKPPKVHPGLWSVIACALKKAPDQRYRTAREMAEALREAVVPMKDHEVGTLVSARFARRVSEVAHWERTKNQRTLPLT